MRARLPARLALGRLTASPANVRQLPQIALCVRGARDWFDRHAGRGPADRIAADRLAECEADPRRRLYLLRAGGELIGLLDLAGHTPETGDATIVALVLVAARRRRGLGSEAAQALFDRLAAAGFSRAHLGVAQGEDDAAAFWAAQGMWEIGVEDGVRLFERTLR